MNWSVIIALALCSIWALVVGIFTHTGNKTMAGRIGPRPRIFSLLFLVPFSFMWAIPVIFFLAIWGGVFWW